MRSKKVTFQVPWPLYELMEVVAPHLGYKGATDLMLWSGFYSCVIGKYHTITAPIAASPPEVQDIFIADLCAAWEKGPTERGSFFEALIEDVVKRFNLPVGPEVVKAMVSDIVRHRPERTKKGTKES